MKNPIQSMAKFAAMLLVAAVSVTSCKKKTEDPEPVENEDITTILLTFRNPAIASDSVVYRAFFSKGYLQAATTPPTFSTTSPKTVLTTGVTYNANVRLFNALVTPVEEITGDITDPNPTADSQEGGVNHQLYYGFNTAFTALTYVDNDNNGKPIGTQITATTSSTPTSSGSFDVKLIHLPNKSANMATTPYMYMPSTIGGSTDVDVRFNNIVLE